MVAVKEGGQWFSEKQEIQNYFKKQFEELYTFECPSIPKGLEGISQHLITEEENEQLLHIPKEDEIKEAI